MTAFSRVRVLAIVALLVFGSAAAASPAVRPTIEAAFAEADAVVVARVEEILGGQPSWRFRAKIDKVIKPASLTAAVVEAAVFGGAQSGGYPANSNRVILFLSRPEAKGEPWDSDLAIDLEALERRYQGIGDRWVRFLEALRDLRAATGPNEIARAWSRLLSSPGFERVACDRLTLRGSYASAPKSLRDEIAKDREAAATPLARTLADQAKSEDRSKRRIALVALRALQRDVSDDQTQRALTDAARSAVAARDGGAVEALLLLAEAGDGSWQRLLRDALVEGRGEFMDELLAAATEAALRKSVSFSAVLQDETVQRRLTALLDTEPTSDATIRFLEAAIDGLHTRPTPALRTRLQAKWKSHLQSEE